MITSLSAIPMVAMLIARPRAAEQRLARVEMARWVDMPWPKSRSK